MMEMASELVRAFNDGAANARAEMADEFAKLKRDLKDCRNELCLRCGEYKTSYLGSCDGCRWRDNG